MTSIHIPNIHAESQKTRIVEWLDNPLLIVAMTAMIPDFAMMNFGV